MNELLSITNLTIDFRTPTGPLRAVDGVSFELGRGETLGLVGESGSGKSVTALSIMGLLPAAARLAGGSIAFSRREGEAPVELTGLPERQLARLRGAELAMIFQEPMTSLNPVFRCGVQVTEALQWHRRLSSDAARRETLALFERVRLPDPPRIFRAYPHELSGGQKQRVMIAMALSCRPALLIADEPTTALDVTVQKTILELLSELQAELGLSMLFISHDLGVIGQIARRVAVMYRGQIVETGAVDQVLRAPEHPYTRGLVACRPSLHYAVQRLPTVADFLDPIPTSPSDPASPTSPQAGDPLPVSPSDQAGRADPKGGGAGRVISEAETAARRAALYVGEPLLRVENLHVQYPVRRDWLGRTNEYLDAVDGVSFDVYAGETFGLAGESGCGKTTLGRTIARLQEATSGVVRYRDAELTALSEAAMRPWRREIQVVFQDPYASLNPRMTIGAAITEPLEVHGLGGTPRQRRARAGELLEQVGLLPAHFDRYPHEFSGGQRQRICIARALALEPRLLICDEIVSALDVSVQAQVLNLLLHLRETFGLTYLFISHDLSVIRQMCDRLLIMNKGKIEDLGFPEALYTSSERPYVRRLIEAVPA